MGTGALSWLESGWGMVLTTHPQVAPRLRMSRDMPPLPLCARMACYRATFPCTFGRSLHIYYNNGTHQKHLTKEPVTQHPNNPLKTNLASSSIKYKF
jgi:hypothetical protein